MRNTPLVLHNGTGAPDGEETTRPGERKQDGYRVRRSAGPNWACGPTVERYATGQVERERKAVMVLLDQLVYAGYLSREQYAEIPTRVGYDLTSTGEQS